MDKQKGYLLEALAKKGLAMCQSYNENSDNVVEAAVGMEEILNNYHEIVKFAEPSDSKVSILVIIISFYCYLMVSRECRLVR